MAHPPLASRFAKDSSTHHIGPFLFGYNPFEFTNQFMTQVLGGVLCATLQVWVENPLEPQLDKVFGPFIDYAFPVESLLFDSINL
jgi:hypothetical protein